MDNGYDYMYDDLTNQTYILRDYFLSERWHVKWLRLLVLRFDQSYFVPRGGM